MNLVKRYVLSSTQSIIGICLNSIFPRLYPNLLEKHLNIIFLFYPSSFSGNGAPSVDGGKLGLKPDQGMTCAACGRVDDSSTLNRRKAIAPRSIGQNGEEMRYCRRTAITQMKGRVVVLLLAFPPTLAFRCPSVVMSETLGF